LCLKECCGEDSDCPNPACQECVDCKCQLKAGAECQHTLDCPMCHDCIDCECVDRCNPATQCCDTSTDTCMDKCVPNGESCNWVTPQGQSVCPVKNENNNWQCAEPEGLTCEWYVIETLHSNSAKCADCAPDCKHWAGSCVRMAAKVCKFVFFTGCGCKEVTSPPTCYVGDYYECN
jgi:hypothetical protein